MKRALLAGIGLFALAVGPATACEWHEMAGYEYGAPQRYSPFARAPQHEPSAQPDVTSSQENAQDARQETMTPRDERAEAQALDRDRASEEGASVSVSSPHGNDRSP
ncbi:MAG: hypothetical protein M0D54_20175 [Hyphomonadaceae bacterium JAD_PAG50586_4]|nr:MAG: hypothetical protein M0D54_20175 [Hyphomonadaceae bacterium JAD_PAG50586_4]